MSVVNRKDQNKSIFVIIKTLFISRINTFSCGGQISIMNYCTLADSNFLFHTLLSWWYTCWIVLNKNKYLNYTDCLSNNRVQAAEILVQRWEETVQISHNQHQFSVVHVLIILCPAREGLLRKVLPAINYSVTIRTSELSWYKDDSSVAIPITKMRRSHTPFLSI